MVSKQPVSMWMSKEVITVTPETTLPEALQLIKENNIRRLPVVDKQGHLVGIVTQGDLQEASPSDATSLNVHEVKYLLAHLTVKEIMTRDPFFATPFMPIASVAQLMYEHKIGGLPVVQNGEVVGIITESDLFRMLATAEPV